MNEMMLQATRLTQASRLIEATALIQRMLRGETDSENVGVGNRPPTTDGYLETIDEVGLPTTTRRPPPSRIISRRCAIPRIASNTLKAWTAGVDAAGTRIYAGHCAGGRKVH